MLQMPDPQQYGRTFWRGCLDEKPRKPFQLSLLLDEEDYRDEHTTLRFIPDSWIETLHGNESLQILPTHHSGLDYANEMLKIFAILVQMDHRVLSIINDFLPFRAPDDSYSHHLDSTGDYHDTYCPRALEAIFGHMEIHREHIRHFFTGRSVDRYEECSWVLQIALCDTVPRFGLLLAGTNPFELYWTSTNNQHMELYSFPCTRHPICLLLFRTGSITKWKLLLSIDIQGTMQRTRSQAYEIRYGGFTTNYMHTWLAMQIVERPPEDRQYLSLKLFLYLLFICQKNVPLQSRTKWADSSSSKGWWLSNGTARDVNQGQHCAEGTQNTGSNSGEGRKNKKENSQQLQRPSTWPFRSSQKRSATTEGLPEGNEDDGSNGKNPHKRRRLENEKTTPRFACPFFKHSPTKFIGERSCCGPGWINVQRVKEHIFRKHGAPEFQCPRCFTDFDHHSDLDEHRRSTVACEVRDRPSAPPRVDKGTMQLLKQRRKSTTPVTELDKWYTVYKIIFPHETQVPSPYYELEEKGLTSPSETTAEEMFQKNLKDTLPLEALTNRGLMDLVMPGIMSAFNRTLSALHDQKTTVMSEDKQLTTTTTTESWHEATRRYKMGQSSPHVDNTVKDEHTDLWTPLSHLDSATQGMMHMSSIGSDSMQSELDTSDSYSSWQTAPNIGFPVDESSWIIDEAFNPGVNFTPGLWVPLPDHDYVWGEEASRD